MKLAGFHQVILLVLIAVFISSCNDTVSTETAGSMQEDPSKSLEKANRYLVKSEKIDIENYIRRHKWTMEETGSGLQYEIYYNGSGKQAEAKDIAVFAYKTWLINGNLVYTSEVDGLKEFLIGKGGVESGLEEAVLLMKEGDKARLILPAHLAFGLLGDEKKIPPRTAIIYDLELVKLK